MSLQAVNWGSVADWVSGIGSLSAVVTALHLARTSDRIRLSATCGRRLIVGGRQSKHQEVISIAVTNIGKRPTVVSGIGLRFGFFNKRYAYIPLGRDQFSDIMPKPLADGERGHWSIELDEQKSWIKGFFQKDLITSKSDIYSTFIQVSTTNGGTFNFRIESNLRKMLLEHWKMR
jgi:hypothetical protein